jgi:hypothetical protein
MTLIGRSGNSSATSSQNTELKETDRIIPNNDNVTTDGDLAALAHISNTFSTRTALNIDQYENTFRDLMTYVEGIPVTVTYYHVNQPEQDIRTSPADIQPMGNPVHKDFTKILHFEMRLQDSLQPTFNPEDNSFDLNGEAVVYPGFEPNVGDQFLMQLDDGNVGEFKVNDKTPMTYRQNRCYKIGFEILNLATDLIIRRLDSGVRETFIFEKVSYPGNDTYTLLKEQTYLDVMSFEQIRAALIKLYIRKFFNEDWRAFVRPDGVYDPYVGEFMKKLLTYKEVKMRPQQIFRRLQDYDDSIWYQFKTDILETFSLIVPKFKKKYLAANALAVDHTALINRWYIALDPEGEEYYVLSNAFYTRNKDSMTPLERILYTYITDRAINPTEVLTLVKDTQHMSDMMMFYTYPIYIELANVAINTLRGKSRCISRP